MKIFIRILLFFIVNNVFSQANLSEKAYLADKIYFYGYDFSHFKFIEIKRFEQGELIKQLIPLWTEKVSNSLDSKHLKKWMGVKEVITNYNATLKKSMELNSNSVIGVMKHELNKDSIPFWIQQYNLKETEGIGCIAFIECFYKDKRESSIWFAFFDLKTKEVYLTQRDDYRGADGHGLDNYWAIGMSENVGHYFNKVFSKERRAYLNSK